MTLVCRGNRGQQEIFTEALEFFGSYLVFDGILYIAKGKIITSSLLLALVVVILPLTAYWSQTRDNYQFSPSGVSRPS